MISIKQSKDVISILEDNSGCCVGNAWGEENGELTERESKDQLTGDREGSPSMSREAMGMERSRLICFFK